MVRQGLTPSLDHYCLSAHCISAPSRQHFKYDHDGSSRLAVLSSLPSANAPHSHQAPSLVPSSPSSTTSSTSSASSSTSSASSSTSSPQLQPTAKPSTTVHQGSTPSLDHYCLSASCISAPSRQHFKYDHDGSSRLAVLSSLPSANAPHSHQAPSLVPSSPSSTPSSTSPASSSTVPPTSTKPRARPHLLLLRPHRLPPRPNHLPPLPSSNPPPQSRHQRSPRAQLHHSIITAFRPAA